MFCKRYSMNITGCSFQVSLFTDELCDRCISTRAASNNPNPWIGYWKERVGIVPGDTKEGVFEKLRDFREGCPTCIRCGGTEYTDFCSMRNVCKQSEEVIEDGGKTTVGKGRDGDAKAKKVGLGFDEAKGTEIRKGL